MPIFLEPQNDFSTLHHFKSVLIVPCPICPAVSLAIQQNKPYMEILRHFLATGALREHVASLKGDLKRHGIRTGIFTSYLPMPLMCLWSAGQRRRLRKRARGYEAVAVLGCDAATFNVASALEPLDCAVVQMMQVAGIVAAIPSFEGPLHLRLHTIGKNSVAWPQRAPAGAANVTDPEPVDRHVLS